VSSLRFECIFCFGVLEVLAYGGGVLVAELLDRIDAVDVDIVKRVASRSIYDKARPQFSLLPKMECSICSLS